MQLISVDLFLVRLALTAQEEDEKFTALVSDAIDATSIYMAAQLDTEFEPGDYTDTFSLDKDVYQSFGGLIRLKLANGFVDGTTVTISSTDSLFDSDATTVQLTAQEVLLDKKSLEKGFIDIPASYMGSFVTVGYSAGIDSTESVPEWLREAALAHATNVMSWQQVGDAKPALGKILEEVGKHKGAILNRHLRTSSRAISPIRST